MARVKLGEVAKECKETCRGSKKGLRVVGLEHLEPENVTLTQWDTNSDNTFTKLFYEGQMLFGRRRAYLKKAAVAPFDGICSGDITVIEANPEKLLPSLMPFIIQSNAFFDFAVERSAGSLSPRVKWEHLSQYEFNLPSLEEQAVLAEVLWGFEKTKAAYKRLLASTEELVQAQFVEMFGTLQNPLCDVKTLDELTIFIKDGTHQTPKYTTDKEQGFKFLSSKDVVSQKIVWDDIKYIPNKLHEELYSKLAPQKWDILLAKNGTTGVAAIVETDDVFDIYVSLALLRFIPGNNVYYLWSAMNSKETKNQFDSRLKGIGVPNLHLGEIKQTKILLPPLNLQNEFAVFIKAVDQSRATIQQSLSALDQARNALMEKTFR